MHYSTKFIKFQIYYGNRLKIIINFKILTGLSNDVTNNIYIHKSVERLKIEIEKLDF